jgi:hypothetical protein
MALLTVDTARCAADTVDGETLIIDTVSGHLRVLTGVAPVVWDRLLTPTDVDALAGEAAERYGPEAATAVRTLVADLRAAELLLEAEHAPTDGPAPQGLAWPETYAAPGVEQYDDIAEIMLMDPVHEVDIAQGWPRKAPDAG